MAVTLTHHIGVSRRVHLLIIIVIAVRPYNGAGPGQRDYHHATASALRDRLAISLCQGVRLNGGAVSLDILVAGKILRARIYARHQLLALMAISSLLLLNR